jgi:cell division protein FtsL
VTKPATCSRSSAVRLARMEAVFIALMVAVVLLSGFVSLVVLYKLLKADNS